MNCNHKWTIYGIDAIGDYRKCGKCGEIMYENYNFLPDNIKTIQPKESMRSDRAYNQMNDFDIIHYGTIIEDDEIDPIETDFIRIRIIAYEGNIYYHRMVNGDVVEFKNIGACE